MDRSNELEKQEVPAEKKFYRPPTLTGPITKALVDAMEPRELNPSNPSNATLIEMVGFAATGRCMACGWPLKRDAPVGCEQGNCSFRPQAHEQEYTRWWMRTQVLTLARVLVSGGPGTAQTNAGEVHRAATGDQ